MTDLALDIQGVTKRFSAHLAVSDLSLQVPRGSVYGLLGPNGAGKTTTIRMILNIIIPDTGTVRLFGASHKDRGLLDRLGYLPEERGLYKKMRMRELLQFFGEVKGRSRDFLAPRIQQWSERMGLSGWLDRRTEELSKGMSQKVQFLMAVLHEPDLLVLDEPFAGLDPVNRDFVRDVVLELVRRGTTVLFSTHVMEQAEALCDRIVLIHHGKIRLAGTVEEVRRTQGGGEAAFVRVEGLSGAGWRGLPGVLSVTDHGNEAELALRPDADTNAILAALLARGSVRRYEVRALSLHEVFKRVVGEAVPQ
jgi:ABC-2 type transport system ATP-binding protein